MLSAFTARSIVELKSRDKSKIESVLAHGDRVFVGLSTGSLRIYKVTDTESSNDDQGDGSGASVDHDKSGSQEAQTKRFHSIELWREEEKFSRRAVQQLAIIKEASLLIALSDGHVSFYDLETYTLSERVDQTKGATCFTTSRNIDRDPESGIHSIVSRMAVAVKRKIMLWTWQDFELTTAAEEMLLPATVKSLTWASSTKLIVGMDPGFSLVDLNAQSVTDINRSTTTGEAGGPNGTRFGAVNVSGMGYMGMGSWVPKPMATKLSDDEMMLAKDVNSLFVDANGAPKEKRQVPWAQAPEAIAYSYPYLLALQPPARGGLELRNPETLTLLQSIPLPNASILHVPQPNISLAHAGKGFLVASDRAIWRMEAVGYGHQIDELIAGGRYDEALSLVNLIEDTLLLDKQNRIQQIKIEKAYTLFERREYRDALELFASAPARPDQVIALYPESIAGSLAKKRSNPARVGSDTDRDNVKPPPAPSSSLPKEGSMRKRPFSHQQRLSDADPASSRLGTTLSDTEKSDSGNDTQAEAQIPSIAVNELRAFLAQTRVQLQKHINYDGTLKESEPMPRNPNGDYELKPPFAHFIDYNAADSDETLRTKLFNAATLVDTTLFRAYMLVSPSLVGSLFRLENFCAADVVEDKLYENGRYNELIDFLWGKKLHEEALKLLEKFGKDETADDALVDFRGPQRTVRYLEQLPFELIDLILQHAEWPMKADPEVGIQIFLADTEHAESLPRDRVLGFLEQFDAMYVMRYLKHIIGELNDPTTSFHNRLVELYIARVAEHSDSEGSNSLQWQEELETFLKTSRSYDKNKILKILPQQDEKFHESRATVLGKLSFHKEALRIYVYQMQNPRRAEEYCNQVYLALTASTVSTLDPDDAHLPQSIYTTLLSLYLSPPPPNKQNLEAALDLLSLHGSRLPALSTLSALPESLPIKDLESYFQARMRAANSIAREEAIMASLSAVEKSSWEADLLLGDDLRPETAKTTPRAGRNRRVVLGENRLCSVCNKRFGRATARVFPDGDVLHYGCSTRRLRADGL